MAEWELHDGKEQAGPLEEDHVIRMIAAGLPETTLIRPVGSEKWKSLRAHAPFAMALEQRAATLAVVPHAPQPAQVVYVQQPPQPAPLQATSGERAVASVVRILGGLVFVFGLVGTIPGCMVGGPAGFLVAFVVMILGWALTRVSAAAPR